MKVVSFFKNVSREMKKVSWPGKQELYRYTVTVVATVVIVALFFTLVDLGITQILNLFFE
ncbi:preprotein translocase subunit SecE [Amphibacillus sp. Q70]|uniref:preprotein translocase subunit SecE n=1 Tax=Amphibacillus sp. Q70 TaxID=3453416 RepID=UPI003F831A63